MGCHCLRFSAISEQLRPGQVLASDKAGFCDGYHQNNDAQGEGTGCFTLSKNFGDLQVEL